jgi:hypothetical protein
MTGDDTRDLLNQAHAALGAYSTRSDFAEDLERGIALAERGETAGHRLLRDTLERLKGFRHIEHGADGTVYLSMFARGVIDQADRALEAPSTSREDAALIREGLARIDAGDETGVRILDRYFHPGHCMAE